MTLSRDRAVPTVVIAVLLALTGCTRDAATSDPDVSKDTGEPAIGAVPTILESVGLKLPVEDYLPTAEQNDRLGQARLVLIQRCMRRFGFSYDVAPVPASAYGPRSLTERRYGITDARLARTAGYGLGPRDPSRIPQQQRPKLEPAGNNVLTGQGRSVVAGKPVPDGGCVAEADRQLDDAVPQGADPRKGHQLQFQSLELSKADSRVRAVFAAWSDCMRQRGYQYADPLAAAADPGFEGRIDAEQIAIAQADIDCKAKANLVGVWFTVETAYQRRAIEADRQGFAATKAAITARDRAAVAIGR